MLAPSNPPIVAASPSKSICIKLAYRFVSEMASKFPILLLAYLLFFTLVSTAHSCDTCGRGKVPSIPGTGNGGGGGGGSGGNGGGGGPGSCPRDALKLGVCANILGLVGVRIGTPPTLPCCSLIAGLADLEAAVCLCTAIRANILGINLNVPISLSVILNNCGRNAPTGFIC